MAVSLSMRFEGSPKWEHVRLILPHTKMLVTLTGILHIDTVYRRHAIVVVGRVVAAAHRIIDHRAVGRNFGTLTTSLTPSRHFSAVVTRRTIADKIACGLVTYALI